MRDKPFSVDPVLSLRSNRCQSRRFLVDGQIADLNATVDESQAIVEAFAYAGRNIDSSLVEIRARGEKSESAAFANPLGTELEDVVSELNVLRVGNSAKLAWHIYSELDPDEWYESLVDAHSGELLLRHKLYVFDAQGTVSVLDRCRSANTAGGSCNQSFLLNPYFSVQSVAHFCRNSELVYNATE